MHLKVCTMPRAERASSTCACVWIYKQGKLWRALPGIIFLSFLSFFLSFLFSGFWEKLVQCLERSGPRQHDGVLAFLLYSFIRTSLPFLCINCRFYSQNEDIVMFRRMFVFPVEGKNEILHSNFWYLHLLMFKPPLFSSFGQISADSIRGGRDD